MRDNEMTIPMVHAFMEDTWGTCIIATTGLVVLVKFIPSQRLSEACPSIGRTTCLQWDKGVVKVDFLHESFFCSYDLYDHAPKTRTICNPKLIAIFSHLKKIQRANQIARMRNSIILLDKGNSSDRGYNGGPNIHVNISEQFTIRECMRPSFEGSVNMDLSEDVDKDD